MVVIKGKGEKHESRFADIHVGKHNKKRNNRHIFAQAFRFCGERSSIRESGGVVEAARRGICKGDAKDSFLFVFHNTRS